MIKLFHKSSEFLTVNLNRFADRFENLTIFDLFVFLASRSGSETKGGGFKAEK
ncbi:MAG: hypothetical protein WA610_09180 [Thermodesulfovibrionales bacterium]